MDLLRRILVPTFITLAAVFVGVTWVAPITLSFYAARKAPRITRVVPELLRDDSVSQAPGMRLSYFGYEFEVPWSDLDDPLTKLYPRDTPTKNRVDLHFRSGLRIVVTAIPRREWARGLAQDLKLSPPVIESTFGPEALQSDDRFVQAVYEFTPARMNHWTTSRGVQNRDELLLMIKSIALLKSAETGIFTLQNQSYHGFQEGNPQARQDGITVHLYSDKGSVEIIFLQKDYKNPAGVTQAEINRMVQSLHATPPDAPTTAQTTGTWAAQSRSDASH